MTDTPIAQAIEKVDAACPCHASDFNICRPKVFGVSSPCSCIESSPQTLPCVWSGHRLTRELAKISQERMMERVKKSFKHGEVCDGCHTAYKRIAVLLLEAIDD